MFDAQTGLLTQPLNIPVLSWLYQTLFGEPLTILNALMLVIATPVTIPWRIIEGQWPADSVAARPSALGAAPSGVQFLLGFTNPMLTLVLRFYLRRWRHRGRRRRTSHRRTGGALLQRRLVGDHHAGDHQQHAKHARLVSVGRGPRRGPAERTGLGQLQPGDGREYGLVRLGPALLAGLSIAQLLVLGLQFHEQLQKQPPPNALAEAAFGITMASLLPGVLILLKLQSAGGAVVVAGLDVTMGVAGGVAGFLALFSSSS